MYVNHPKSNYRRLSQDQFKKILSTIGLTRKQSASTKLQAALIDAISSYFALRFFQTRLSHSATKFKLKGIKRAADKLLKALDIDPAITYMSHPAPELESALMVAAIMLDPASLQKSPVMSLLTPPSEKEWEEWGSLNNQVCFSATLEGTIVGTRLLAHWAELAPTGMPARAATEGKSARARHHGDTAMNGLIVRLAVIYEETTGKKPGASVPDPESKKKEKDAYGPFIRFVQACCQSVKENMSSEMKRADPALDKVLRPTGYAIRARLRVLNSVVESSSKKA